MALILIRFFDVNGIWAAITISSIMKGNTSYGIYKHKIWRKYKDARIN